jgi:hypothetical protein
MKTLFEHGCAMAAAVMAPYIVEQLRSMHQDMIAEGDQECVAEWYASPS